MIVLMLALPAFAQIADREKVASEISSSILSPFCPGRVLSDCPSTDAGKLKHQIRERLYQGQTREEVEKLPVFRVW